MESFGNITLAGSHWMIQCEPHVRARLKRVFPRAPQQAGTALCLSRTPENSRELEWFIQRYPMQVTPVDALVSDANEHRGVEQRIADWLARRIPPENIQLAIPPRDYQTPVAQLLAIKKGLLLADDVGLGKTVSGICCLVDPAALPAVIVAPPHLLTHWKKMIGEFAPTLRVHVIKKPGLYPLYKEPKGRQLDLIPDRLPDVIIVSYFRLRTWSGVLSEIAKMVIFEECQQLRQSGSQIYSACRQLAARVERRLGLSATPIYNYGSEFFNVVDCLIPDSLGTHEEFIREWCSPAPGGNSRLSNAEEFGAWLRREGVMLRRTRKEVGRELPPVTKIVHEIDADLKVLDSLTGSAVALAKTILAHSENFRGERMQAAGEFDMIMRQATGVAKAPYVAEMVRMLVESGEKVLLFGWHRAVYDIWIERLKEFKPALYTGSESASQKDASLKAFIEGDSKVLIMSLRSGSGVDGLQHVCRIVVFGELDWSPGVHEQCIGRPARDGQEEPVTAYFLVAEDGSDPIVAEVNGVKREQIEGVRNPGQATAERVDTGENNLRRLAREFLAKRGDFVE